MFNSVFLRVGNRIVNESAIHAVDLDHNGNGKVVVDVPGGQLSFSGRSAEAWRRLFSGDPAIWGQAEGPDYRGVLDLTAGEGAG
jgi:hypothetical protein